MIDLVCPVPRCALLITTLLVLVNIFNSVVATTPGEADGLTALIIWIMACITFTFFSLLSYVFILARTKWFLTDEQDECCSKRGIDLDLILLIFNITSFVIFGCFYFMII